METYLQNLYENSIRNYFKEQNIQTFIQIYEKYHFLNKQHFISNLKQQTYVKIQNKSELQFHFNNDFFDNQEQIRSQLFWNIKYIFLKKAFIQLKNKNDYRNNINKIQLEQQHKIQQLINNKQEFFIWSKKDSTDSVDHVMNLEKTQNYQKTIKNLYNMKKQYNEEFKEQIDKYENREEYILQTVLKFQLLDQDTDIFLKSL